MATPAIVVNGRLEFSISSQEDSFLERLAVIARSDGD